MTPESAGRFLRACDVEPRVGAYDPRPPEDRELLRQMRRLQSDQRNKLGDGAIAAAQDLEDGTLPWWPSALNSSALISDSGRLTNSSSVACFTN